MADRSTCVSVLMPLKNAGQFVESALRSILVERDIPLEVIVVNDSSTDDSVERVIALSDPRVLLIDSKKAGISESLNTALQASTGSIIMRCDADDLFCEGRIKEQVSLLNLNQKYAAICGSFSTIDARGMTLLDMSTGAEQTDITEDLAGGVSKTHLGTYAIRARACRQLQGFRPYFDTAEDLDFQLRLAGAGHVLYVPKCWYQYRIHSNSVTHSQANERRLFFEKIAKEFAFQRATTGTDLLERGTQPLPPEPSILVSHDGATHAQELLIGRAWLQFSNGHIYAAHHASIRAIAVRPSTFEGWRNLFVLSYKTIVRLFLRN
jgi:glycosyltransferase involved in cell wall biosynthesis